MANGVTRGQFSLCFVQPENEGTNAFEQYVLRTEKLEHYLKYTLKEICGDTTVSRHHENGVDKVEIECAECDAGDLHKLIVQALGRYRLLDVAKRIETH